MHNVRKLSEDLYYIGCSDRRLTLFESAYPIPEGISYNSFLLKDNKTVLFDTVDKACSGQFFENLKYALDGKKLDYLIVHHMEPDHGALISDLISKCPEVKIVCTAKSKDMLKQFFDFDVDAYVQVVKEGESLNTGKHELIFTPAPMVHWPEVMVTYDKTTKSLFSADAFGSFGAINGNLFDDEINWSKYISEARRYYSNIVGKYGTQVQLLLKKLANFGLNIIYPLHGVFIREHIAEYVEKYNKWSTYTPEEKGVVIAYSSVYGGTENAVDILAAKLADNGIKDIKIHDLSYTNPSVVLADIFKYSHAVFATTTYNMGIFESMEQFLHILTAHNVQNRTFALIENGSWAPACGGQMRTMLEGLKGVEFISDKLCIKSALKEEQLENIDNMAREIADSVNS